MAILSELDKKKKLSELEETFKQIQKSAGALFGQVAKEGVTGAGGEMLIKPTQLPGLGDEVKDRSLEGGEQAKTPEELLTQKTETALTEYANAPSLVEEKKRLEGEKGVLGMKATVGSFEDEVNKTQTLLDSLEEDITKRTQDYLVSEPQRNRLYASEQAPLLKSLDISQRGLATAQGRLDVTNQDILTELGLIEKEKTVPLDLLEREVGIRSKIKDLATKDIPNVATSQFNDEGDLTIVTQDPTTGKFNTQTIKGIGKKAAEYDDYQVVTNAQGDVSIIGIGPSGAKEIGLFKGVGKAVDENEGIVNDFNKDLSDWNLEGTREQFIRQLQAKFPNIDANDITRKVYETYPDGYEKGTKKENTENKGNEEDLSKIIEELNTPWWKKIF